MTGRLLRRVDEFCASGQALAKNVPQVVAVAPHGPQPAVMGWPTPLKPLTNAGT